MSIYVDEIFFINLTINFILLFITRKLTRSKTGISRLILGSAIASIYSVGAYFPKVSFIYRTFGKLSFSALLMFITYNIPNIKEFIRKIIVFYATSFVFGGTVYAALSATGSTPSNTTIKILAISFTLSLFVIHIFTHQYIHKITKERNFVNIEVSLSGNTTCFVGLVDTGHSLCDPLGKRSVVVVEFDKIKELLPMGFRMEYSKGNILEASLGTNSEFQRRIKMIPFKSLGNNGDLMVGIKTDVLKINENTVENGILGIYNGKISTDNTYFGLVGIQNESEVTA